MKSVSRQLALLIVFYLIIYGILYGISLVIVPPCKVLDTLASKRTVYYAPNKMLAAGIAGLGSSESSKMIILGASNVLSGLRPVDLRPLFSNYELHNLALGNHNVSRIRLEIELIQQTLPRHILDKTFMLMGIWYGSFTENGPRRKLPLLDVEKVVLDSGLFVRTPVGIQPVLPARWMPLLVAFLRPYYFVEYLTEKIQFKDRTFGLEFHQYDVWDESFRGIALEYFGRWMGRSDNKIGEEQFNELVAIADLVDKRGGTLVIVDLPLPDWHTQRSAYCRDYMEKKKAYLARALRSPRVRHIDLSTEPQLSNPDLYYDSTHPNPEGARLLAEKLKERWDGLARKSVNSSE